MKRWFKKVMTLSVVLATLFAGSTLMTGCEDDDLDDEIEEEV